MTKYGICLGTPHGVPKQTGPFPIYFFLTVGLKCVENLLVDSVIAIIRTLNNPLSTSKYSTPFKPTHLRKKKKKHSNYSTPKTTE